LKQLFARSRPSQIQGLQFVRSNAVLLVVLCHAAAVLGLPEYFDQAFLGGLLNKGAVGVDIFFVLSGFIIVHVALKQTTLEAKARPELFLLKRAVRIVPFLWVAVIAYAAVRYVGTREFEWLPYFNSMFLVPVGEVRPNVVWSLRHEALFYIIFAVAFLLRKRMSYVLYAWCSAPIVVWLGGVVGLQMPSSELFEFVFNRANAMFGCGVLIGIVCKRYGLPKAPLSDRPVLAWVALGAATVTAFLVRDSLSSAAVAIAASVTLVVGLLTPNAESSVARLWEMLGNASYSIYLTHNMFLLVGATAWVKILGPSGFEVAIFALGTLAVAGGVLVHFVVERPLIAFTNRVVSRKKEPTLVA
jgi:exopolysaccharide production protein ExoZ